MGDFVKGLAWLGTRTDRYAELVSFYRDVMGLELDHEEDTFVAFKLPDGSNVEVFSPDDEDHRFFTTGPVAGFAVEDIDDARSRLEKGGAEFIGDIVREAGMAWAHFRAPDGNVYEITKQ